MEDNDYTIRVTVVQEVRSSGRFEAQSILNCAGKVRDAEHAVQVMSTTGGEKLHWHIKKDNNIENSNQTLWQVEESRENAHKTRDKRKIRHQYLCKESSI